VTDGQMRLGPEGDPNATPPLPGGMRDGPWCRGRNVPHLGCWPTARARGHRPPRL
jgi:hypothetical protein